MAWHDHTYERLQVDGIPYFVNGLGGGSIYRFVNILPESQFRYTGDHGAMLVTATPSEMELAFFDVAGELIDAIVLGGP